MRQGQQQNRRGRNRGGRKPQNSISRNYESSGPDVKIRGTAMHIAEKYSSLARDAMASGDIIGAENYLQHAEHYNRIIMAAQAQNVGVPGLDGPNGMNGNERFQQDSYQRDSDGGMDDGDDDDFVPRRSFNERPNYHQHQQPQPYIPQQAFPQTQPQPQPQPQSAAQSGNGAEAQPGETPAGPNDADRGAPRRRRRRPMGEGAPIKPYNGRNGANHSANSGLNGSAPANDSPSDEAAS